MRYSLSMQGQNDGSTASVYYGWVTSFGLR